MGHRPVEIEPVQQSGTLSRPAELVQRARQLAQLTNYQFGRNSVSSSNGNGQSSAGTVTVERIIDEPKVSQPMVEPPAPVKTTAQKIEEFYGVKQIGDEVIFAARFSDAKKVLIAGDFNNWSPMSTPMVTTGNGQWKMRLPLPPGRYRYRFVVDGKWMTDPNNKYVETNQFGELNNIVEVD
jgi:hypothetical protein